MNQTVDILALLATLAAVWAAWEANQSAKATKDTAEASLVASFFDDYFAPEMANALRVLGQWRRDKGDPFAQTWINDLSSAIPHDKEQAQRVDQARRHVKGYFEKAARLHSSGLIRLKALQSFAYVAGLNLYYDVIDPLELAINADRSSSTKDVLLSTLGRYKEGERIRPISPT